MNITYEPRKIDLGQLTHIGAQAADPLSRMLLDAALERGDTVGVYYTMNQGWEFAFRPSSWVGEVGLSRALPGTLDGFPLIAVYTPC